jgi:hypothetical protein
MPDGISRIKRFLFEKPWILALLSKLGSFFTIKLQTRLMCVAIPVVLIVVDMFVSDPRVLFAVAKYYVSNEHGSISLIMDAMFGMLGFYYFLSLFSMLSSPFMFSLNTAYNTGLSLHEVSETSTPLGKA